MLTQGTPDGGWTLTEAAKAPIKPSRSVGIRNETLRRDIYELFRASRGLLDPDVLPSNRRGLTLTFAITAACDRARISNRRAIFVTRSEKANEMARYWTFVARQIERMK